MNQILGPKKIKIPLQIVFISNLLSTSNYYNAEITKLDFTIKYLRNKTEINLLIYVHPAMPSTA